MEHYSVLLNEAIEGLNIRPEGIYVDGTLGRGGHSSEILKRLSTGHLYSFDIDDEAFEYSRQRMSQISDKFTLIKANFADMKEELENRGIYGVDGILLSCTIFSPFIDQLRLCTDLPLVAADIGVFEKAAQLYRKVGAVVSFAPTLKSVAWVVERCRRQIAPGFDVEIKYAEGALEAAAAGDVEEHNRILYETALQFEGKDAIILSQMSQIRALPLFENHPVPVLTSPSVSLGLLIEMINERKKD